MLLTFFDGINFDFDGMEFVFEQQVLFRVDSLFDLRPHGLVPGVGERGQNLEHLNFSLRKHPRMFYTPSFTLLYSRKGEIRGTQNEGLSSGLDENDKRRCRNLIIF